jgi:hypothetical protein
MIAMLYCVAIFSWIGSWSNATTIERQAFYTVATILLIATVAMAVFCSPTGFVNKK